jgi:hypothetical protein
VLVIGGRGLRPGPAQVVHFDAEHAVAEVARNLPGAVAVRDTKDPDGPKLAFAPEEWIAFTAGVKAGEFDLP